MIVTAALVSAAAPASEIVTFPSGALTLKGVLFKPAARRLLAGLPPSRYERPRQQLHRRQTVQICLRTRMKLPPRIAVI